MLEGNTTTITASIAALRLPGDEAACRLLSVPHDLIVVILSFLMSPIDLSRSARTSHILSAAAATDTLWANLARNRGYYRFSLDPRLLDPHCGGKKPLTAREDVISSWSARYPPGQLGGARIVTADGVRLGTFKDSIKNKTLGRP